MRWAYQTPIKRAAYYHPHDFCSEHWPSQPLSGKTVSGKLKHLGENREKAVAWMKTLLNGIPDKEQNFALMDSTHALSVSKNLAINAKGYNPNFDYEKQIRLMYLFSAQMKQPVLSHDYLSYQQRNEIEVMFDSYKNCLDADVSHMQNRYVMEGWLFANFVAMIAYYKLHVKLRQAELLSKYSPKGIIERSKAIYKMKIRGRWIQSENTKKMQRLFAKFPVAVVFWEVLQAGGGSGARQLNF